MSVISITEDWSGRGSTVDSNGKVTYTRRFLVVTNDHRDGPKIVESYAGVAGFDAMLPRRHSPYVSGNDQDVRAFCKGLNTSPGNDWKHWIVTAEYDNEVEREENPLLRPTRYRIDWAQFTRIVERDINGRPLVNTALQAFDPPVEQDDSRPVLVAVKNFPSLDPIIALSRYYKDAVNADAFYGAGPREAKVQSITCSDLQEENEIQFYQATFRIEFKDDGTKWDRSILNQGTMAYKKEGEDKPMQITDEQGVPASDPVLLAADGTRLPKGQDPIYLDFTTYPIRSFAGLGI